MSTIMLCIFHQLIMATTNQQSRRFLSRSIIKEQQTDNCCVRCLQTFDIFSFIPVPKSRTISTKCSLIGSILFFTLFLSFIIYDFVQFVSDNPPLPNSFYEDLGDGVYQSPKFAMTFMTGEYLEQSLDAPPYFNFTLEQSTKYRGGEKKDPVSLSHCNPDWLGEDIFSFYKELQCSDPNKNLTMMGLLYSSNTTTNPKIGISLCIKNSSQDCVTNLDMQSMMAKGRVFLFIERTLSKYDEIKNSNFLLYNFFLVPNVYNRINIQMQVNREIIKPDYLTRWKEQESTRLEILSTTELNSNVVINGPESAAKILSIEFTLAPSIKITEIAYSTLIDHISKWGALWGVEFAVFALIFLAYNRKKYYQKNPKWSRFDEQDGDVIQTDSYRQQ